jgi:hypothetical protein
MGIVMDDPVFLASTHVVIDFERALARPGTTSACGRRCAT